MRTEIKDVYAIRVEADEDGFFHLVAEGENGDVDLAFGHEQAEALYDQVKAAIGPWLRERDQAQRHLEMKIRGVPGVFRCDPDESGGYALDDPKHPAFHSTHVAIWDERDKTAGLE